MVINRRSWLCATIALGVVGTGRSAFAQAAAVRIGTSPSEPYAQAFYAQEAGFFQKAGLNVDVQLLGTGAAVAGAVAGGSLDVGVTTIVNLANAIARGLPFVMIAPALVITPASPGALLCVAVNSPLRTAKDFEGKTIAVPALRQTEDLSVRAWLRKGGADVAKVQVIEAPFGEMAPGLARGTFAGADIAEPALTDALSHNLVRKLSAPLLSIAPNFTLAAWFTTTSFMQKNPGTVKSVATALMESARWANTHHDQTAAIVARNSKVDVEIIRGAVRPIYGEELRPASIQPQLDAAYANGFLTRPMKAAELLDSHRVPQTGDR